MVNYRKKNAVLSGLVLLFVLCFSVSWAETPSFYSYRMTLKGEIPPLFPDEVIRVPLRLKNISGLLWPHSSEDPVNLSYHWLDREGRLVVHDGERTPVPAYFKEGILRARVMAPDRPGHFFIEFDLVHENVTWFAKRGATPLRVPVRVKDPVGVVKDRPAISGARTTAWWCDMDEINRIQRLIRATLAIRSISFEGLSGQVAAFSAGSSYPQLWIRDLATILPLARYYFGSRRLGSWIDEFLFFQEEDGGICDWIDSRGLCDKNTVESDQESSLVIAASHYYDLTGDREWLGKRIGGLDAALRYILHSREDEETGLMWSGYTADWGDISPIYPDHRAVYFDSNTPRAVGLYTNALFCLAARSLAGLHKELGRAEDAKIWLERAETWRSRVNSLFWSGRFYRMHASISSPSGDKKALDSSLNIFPMGGNAQAMLARIPNRAKVNDIYAEALERRREYGLSTIAGTLVPPFPRGFFKHPAMKEPFSYQNGGQWDWFAGRFILGLFRYGLVGEATSHLRSVCGKVLGNGKFHEWDTVDGRGRGSQHYTGAAAAMGLAVVEGLFGISGRGGRWTLNIGLGEHEGEIRVFLPATGSSLYYGYRPSEDMIDLKLRTKRPHGIRTLRVWKSPGPWKKLLVNGRRVNFSKVMENGEWYYSVDETDGPR